MEFKEWWEEWGREDPGIREKVSRGWAEFIWDASRANMVESESEDPTPTEMVRRLLEKGWEFIQMLSDGSWNLRFQEDGECYPIDRNGIERAYSKAFHPKKRVEVEVWRDRDGNIYGRNDFGHEPENEERWIKGTAVFWVEEE